jgi:DNA-binding PadR family transcriptional regulator
MNIQPPKLSPLTLAEYYVLAALAMQDAHAYLLCQKVERDSDRALHISCGWMARILKKLIEERCVERTTGGGRTQLYKLTPYGQKRLEREISQHQRAVIVGQTALAQAERYTRPLPLA